MRSRGRQAGGDVGEQRPGQLALDVQEERGEQSVLVREIGEERALGDARLPGDLGGRRARPQRRHQFGGGGEDRFLLVVAERAGHGSESLLSE